MSIFDNGPEAMKHVAGNDEALVSKIWGVTSVAQREYDFAVDEFMMKSDNPLVIEKFKDHQRNEIGSRTRRNLVSFTSAEAVTTVLSKLDKRDLERIQVCRDALEILNS